MKNKKITASILSASLLATPTIAQLGTLTVFAQENSENAANIPYDGDYDCVTNEKVTQGLSLMVQNQGGGDYKHCGVKIYKLPDDATIDGSKQNSTINGESADKYDLNNATLVTTYHTISLEDRIWTNSDGSITERDGDVGLITGHPTFKSLDAGKYVLVYDGDYAGFAYGAGFGGSYETYQRISFEVTSNKVTSIDVEESEKAKVPEATSETGSVEVQAIMVETDDKGNVKKDENGNFIPTGEKVANVTVNPDGDMYLTDEVINATYEQMGGLMSKDAIVSMLKTQGYKDARNLSLTTNIDGTASASNVAIGNYSMKTTIPEGYTMADADNDSTFTYDVQKDGKDIHVIELYKTPETDDNTPENPTEVPQGIRVLVKDRETGETIEGAKFNVVASNDKDFSFADNSTKDGVIKTAVKADTYTASLVSVPSNYKLNMETTSITLKPVTTDGVVTDMILYVDKAENPIETGALVSIVRDKDTKEPISNAKVDIVDKDGKVILSTTTNNEGKVSKDDLPIGDYTVKVTEVPSGYKVPNSQVGTVKANEVTTLIFEVEKNTGALDVIVRDKDTKEPIPNAKVDIVDKDGKVILSTTTNNEGKVSKDKLPTGDYTVKVTEVPNGYNLPEDQKTTIKKDETSILIFEVEKSVGALDVIVRDKDTKEAIPNAKVDIVDKDGKVVESSITDSNGKISKDKLPIGDYTIKVTKVPEKYKIPEDQKGTVYKNETTTIIFELEKGVGALDVVVRDKDTKEPIPNAKVQVVDKDGNIITETTTDSNGKISKDKLPIGDYTIKVLEVPDGYNKPNDQTVTIKKNVKTTIIFELQKGVGTLEVVVRDKDTKVLIPNATVQIVDKDGIILETTNTDDNGKVRKEKLPVGDYTIKVIKVPDGYNIPENQVGTVKKNETTSLIFEIEKNTGALDVVVRDKDTKEPIPNAKVEVVDKDGNVILETTTDSNGKVSKDKLPIGDYTIKVLEVPDGYNKPNDQVITIKKSVKTTVIFELEKDKLTTTSLVQTGDNNNILGLVLVGMVSFGGMLFALLKRKDK